MLDKAVVQCKSQTTRRIGTYRRRVAPISVIQRSLFSAFHNSVFIIKMQQTASDPHEPPERPPYALQKEDGTQFPMWPSLLVQLLKVLGDSGLRPLGLGAALINGEMNLYALFILDRPNRF